MKKGFFIALCFFINITSSILADDDLLKLAESGNPEAQYKVAAMYASGKIGNKSEDDKKKVFYWLEESASQNYLKAQEILCSKYYERNEFEKSWKWTNIALKNGSNVAKSVMAGFLMNGNGGFVPINKTKAIALAKECPNEVISKSILCEMYASGWIDTEPDLKKAMTIAEELSKKNYYAADLYKSMILRNSPDRKATESILAMLKSFEKAMELNKYSYEIKSAYVNFAISVLPFYNDLKGNIENVINELINANEAIGYYCKYYYEYKINQNRKSSQKYLFKAADMYCPESYFEAYFTYLLNNSDEDLKKARKIAEKALKCQDPECLNKFIVFFNTIEKNEQLRKVIGEAYIDGFNSLKNIKIAADNGDPAMMYLYSKLTTDKSENKKYLIGAANRGFEYACGDVSLALLKTDPEKAYKLAYSVSKSMQIASPEVFYVLGICSLAGKGCLKNVLFGLEQLDRAVSEGISNKAKIIKTIYDGYCNIDENEYLKKDKNLTSENTKIRKQSDIYLWGTAYMEYASDDEKQKFDEISKNLLPEAIRIGKIKIRKNSLSKINPESLNRIDSHKLIVLGKVFSDAPIEKINDYVNKIIYNSLFVLYGKKDDSGKKSNIPDECYDNLKKLTMAIEMYNMDHMNEMTTLDLKELRKNNVYLRGDLNKSDPECSYSIEYSKDKVIVHCSKHGSM